MAAGYPLVGYHSAIDQHYPLCLGDKFCCQLATKLDHHNHHVSPRMVTVALMDNLVFVCDFGAGYLCVYLYYFLQTLLGRLFMV